MPDAPFRFAFGEVARVVSDDPALAPINGERGVALGRGEDGSDPDYGVFVYRAREVWYVAERALEPTGAFDPREAAAHALRVRVDAEGRGHVVGVRKR